MAGVNLQDDQSLQFLENYINNAAPSGFESNGQQIWLDHLKPYIDDYTVDTYGTTVGFINHDADFKVVLEAHADEISWFINYISDKGFLYVKKLGGSDQMIPPSKRVNIHTDHGAVRGVFGWPAIHSRDSDNDEKPSVKNLFIDIGCTSKYEVEEQGVHVGCPITFDDKLEEMNQFLCGRALDNRIGGFIIAQVAKMLKENNTQPSFGVYFVNSVQEEVGLRGAQMITERINPDVALVTDVCHDTQTPRMDKSKEGDLSSGAGPVLTYGPAVQYNLLKLIVNAAEEKNIPFQRRTTSRGTGTDTDSFAYSNGGVASSLISLPLRYMHTSVEMVQKSDVENLIQLMYESLLKIENNHDFNYFR